MRNPSIEPLEARIAPAVLSFAGPVEITEGQSGQSDMIFKVLLDIPSPTPLTVKVSTLDGTATVANGDYSALTDFLVEIPANTVEKTFVVKVNGDTDYEPNETFSVVLSSPSAGHSIGATSSATGTILRGADVPPTITIANASIVEKNDGTQQMKFTVSLSNKASEAVTFEWKTNDLPFGVGAAVAGVDYTAVPAGTMVTIDAGTTTKDIFVDLMPDRVVEPNETFEVQLSNPKLAVELTALSFPLGSTGKAVGTIINDEPTVSLELSSSPTPNEGTGTANTTVNFTIRLSVAASESVVVKLSTTGITATGGADFTLPTTDFLALDGKSVTVQAGQTTVTVPVTVRADSIYEGNEKFSLKIDEAKMGSLDLTPVASPLEVTIINDEALPTLSVKGATLVEPATGTTAMNFVVTLSSAADKDVTFSWNTIAGTATGLDFTEVTATTATIPAGQTSVNLPVTILSDALAGEGNESFSVGISGGMLDGQAVSNAVGGGTALGTIRSTALGLSVVGPTTAVTEGTGGADGKTIFKITRGDNDSLAETIVVRVSTVDGSGTLAGNDFRPLDKALFTIPNGFKEIIVPVDINPDNIDESDETFSLRIDSAEIGGANFQGITVASATATITDDDNAPTISIGDATVVEGHSGTKKLAFVVSLSGRATSDITLTYVTELDTTADAADAADFVQVLSAEMITIPAGQSSKTVEITINGDTDRENAETFTVRIGNAMLGTTALTVTDATGKMTIQPDEPIVTITGPAAISEGSTTGGKTDMTFTVRLDKVLAEPTAVRVSTVNGTAVGGEDFEAVSGKWVLIPAGSLTGTFTVPVLHDDKVENAESFTVAVDEVKVGVGATLDATQQPTGGVVQPPKDPIAPATGTINNDDLATLSISDATVVEGNSGTKQLSFTVSLSKPAGEAVTFRYATQNGSALGGTDFTAFSGVPGTIPAGQQSVTITVDVLGDATDEADETFSVLLSEPRFATNTEVITLADGVGLGKILNDEITVSINSAQAVAENTPGAVPMTITLSQASLNPVQVTLSLTNGTAIKGVDFSDPNTLLVTIPAGQTSVVVSVPILNDTAFENPETFDVYLIGATNAQLSSEARGTVTITSEDAAPKLTITAESKNEGTKLTSTEPDFTDFVFTATLDRASGSPVTFDWKTLALSGGTNATAGDDFTAVTTTSLTIPAGSTTATFVVKVSKEAFGQAVHEANELLTVEVSSVAGAELQNPDVANGTVKTIAATILNDEPERTLSFADVRKLEGNAGSQQMDFVVRLSGRADRDVTFNWQTASGGGVPATAGDDYTSVPVTAVTIPAGTTEITLSVPIAGDTGLEADETFLVQLSNARIGTSPITNSDFESIGTIRNDEITARIDPLNAAVSVTEGDDNTTTPVEEFVEVRIPVTLSQAVPSGQTITVGWKFVTLGASATIDTDYKADSFLVSFAAGEITKDIVVKIRPDLLSELNETFTVELNDDTTVNAAVNSSLKTSVVTILDNEPAPVISIKSVGGLESDGKLVFTITMDRRASTDVSFDIETIDGTAVSSGLQKDFTARALETLRFLATDTNLTKTFEVTLTNDLDNTEPLENFVVRLSNATVATLSGGQATLEATGTIAGGTDSSIKISDVTVTEGSTAGSPAKMNFVVNRTGDTTKAVTGRYTITFDALLAAGITAADAADLVSGLTGTFSIPAGQNSATIALDVNGDAIVEGDQRFRISLGNIDGAFFKAAADASANGTIVDDDLTIRFRDSSDPLAKSVISAVEGNSGTTDMVFFVDLNAPAPKETIVTFVVTHPAENAATEGTDYTLPQTTVAPISDVLTVTIPAGATSGSYVVKIVGDAVAERTETFTVAIQSAPGATIDAENKERTGKIVNDDATFEVVGTPRVVEGQSGTSNLVFQVKLSDVTPVSGTEYSVSYSVSGNTATVGQDFTATSGTLTFTDNGIKTISVPIIGDTAVENDETMTLTISDSKLNTQAITAIFTAAGIGTIQDDETTVSIGNATIVEGNVGQQTLDFIVNIPLATTIPIVVKYSTVDVTAVGAAADATDLTGKDYRSVVDGTVTIAPGQTRATISIPVFGDLVKETTETFKVRITEVSGAAASAFANEGTGTITDNADPAPTLSIADAQITEGDAGPPMMKFRVSLSQAANEAVTFNWSTATGTASATDFTGKLAQPATIPIGATFVDLEVPVTPDALVEGNEIFTVTLSGAVVGASALTVTDAVADGTILDDDGVLRVKASDATVSFAEDDGAATPVAGKAKVKLDISPIAGSFTVTYTLTAGPAGDVSATAATDYTVPTTLSKTFAAGTAADDLFIEVDLKADAIDEWDEKFTVTITGVTGAKLDATAENLKSVVTITDNDDGPKLQLTNVTVQESSANANFVVKLVGNLTERDIAISWEALSGTALSGTDFTARTGQTFTITAGQREGTMVVPITNDSLDEVDETFRVAITDSKFTRTGTTEEVLFVGEENPADLGTKHSATATILRNDLRTATVSGASVVEGATGDTAKTLDFKIRLDSAPSSVPITVNYTTVDGTAFGGSDFTAATGSVTFLPGETEKTVSITVTPDNTAEADETMKLRISLPGDSSAQLGASPEATGTIEADESVFKLEQVIAPGGSAVVTEGQTAKFKVTRTGAIDFPAVISYSALEDATAIGDVRAKAAIDFIAKTGSITFAAGEVDSSDFGQFIEIAIINDTVAELDGDRFLVRLTNATNGALSATDAEKTVVLADNDAGPDPFVRIEPASVNEGGSLSFKVKLVTAAGAPLIAKYPVLISYEALLGAAGPGIADSADFTSAFPVGTKTVEIATGQSEGLITIATLQDTTPEKSETVSVKLTKAEKNFGGLTQLVNPFYKTGETIPNADVTTLGTILNDDSTITVANVSQAEGNTGTSSMEFVATLPQVATFDVKFHYKTKLATGNGAATQADFTAVEGDVTIPAGSTQASFTVTVTADTIKEGTETFEVELSAPVDGILANANDKGIATVTGTIQNDDVGPQIRISQTSISEGAAGSTAQLLFTVTLEGEITEDVTVNFATADGTASATGAIRDYIAKQGALTFVKQTGVSLATQTIAITVNGDDFKEGDENLSVTLSNATGGVDIVTASATGTIIDDTDSSVGVYLLGTKSVEGTAASFTIGFTSLPTSEMTFKVSTRNGTANASDFTQITGRTYTVNGSTLSFAGGASTTINPTTRTATISVPTTNDSTFEATESFHLDLSAPTGGAIAGASATAVIYNDDFRIINSREFEFIDEDGDLVNMKVSKGTLFTRNSFGQLTDTRGLVGIENAGTVGGKNITTINLLGTGREFEGASIFVTRKAQAGFDLPTDGKVNVGSIVAANAVTGSLQQGVNLGTVKVDGDLGRIDVGSTLRPTSITKLDVGSLGVRPTTFSDTVSSLYGRAGSILVRGNVEGVLQLLGTTVNFANGFTTGLGSLGSLTVKGKIVGGSADNSGYISSNARISKVTVGGIEGGSGANSGQIFVTSALSSFVALGDVTGGSGIGSGHVVAGSIGKVEFGKAAKKGVAAVSASIVGGDAGPDTAAGSTSVFAQVGSGAVVSFTGIGSVKMNGGSKIIGGDGDFSGMIFSNRTVSKLQLGDIEGGAGDNSGRVRVFGNVGSLTAGTILGGGGDDSGQIDVENRISQATIKNIFGPTIEEAVDGDIVDAGSLRAGDLGNVLVTGSMKMGDITGGSLISTGSIVSKGSISSLTVKGAVEGLDANHHNTISAGKNIGRANIGTLKFAELLAGYDGTTTTGRGALSSADAQIGVVSIGEFIGSSIVAGVDAGDDEDFGTSDDIVPTAGVTNVAGIISRIASITIKTTSAVDATEDSGLVAQDIGLVKVGGVRIALNPSALVPLPGTQVFINEV